MFGIRRRWPVLTAVGAAALYMVNNYQIAGLEHLHLKPLEHPRQSTSARGAQALDGSGINPFEFDLTQFGIRTPPPLANASNNIFTSDPYSARSPTGSPEWNDLLSVGEKLALWQDKLADRGNTSPVPVSGERPAFPSSSPIPVPDGLFPNRASSLGDHALAYPPAANLATPQSPIPSGTMTSLGQSASGFSGGTVPRDSRQTIRIASFKVPALATALLNKPQVVQMLIAILRQYDVVALQGISSSRDDVLPLFVDKLNLSGCNFDYLIGPRVGRAAPHQQFAYLFDTSRLETDRYQLYSVDDPDDLVNYEPLVAWFRCKGIPQAGAFTFSLVNVSIDPNFADAERSVLPGLVDAIEHDGRHEDDWILLGDFSGGNAQLQVLNASGVRFAISDIPTDIGGTQMLDTILFSGKATTEFTGRAGAQDFLRKHNLSIEQALEVSPRMPVWAEFSCLEGAQPGHIAPVTGSVQ